MCLKSFEEATVPDNMVWAQPVGSLPLDVAIKPKQKTRDSSLRVLKKSWRNGGRHLWIIFIFLLAYLGPRTRCSTKPRRQLQFPKDSFRWSLGNLAWVWEGGQHPESRWPSLRWGALINQLKAGRERKGWPFGRWGDTSLPDCLELGHQSFPVFRPGPRHRFSSVSSPSTVGRGISQTLSFHSHGSQLLIILIHTIGSLLRRTLTKHSMIPWQRHLQKMKLGAKE